MQQFSVNEETFSELDTPALEFYRRNGFVVISNRFESESIDRLEDGTKQMIAKMAGEMGQPVDEYTQFINQWRDLWKTEAVFKDLLHDERLHGAAQFFMEEPCVQLLHDHMISKPAKAKPAPSKGCYTNALLPWHQDYPSWPVNTPHSLTMWLPFEDVSEDGGCLEVVAGSHKWGASKPVDLIMEDPDRFKDRDDVNLVRIPVSRGSLVVQHSLTWHRSHPNHSGGTQRSAYIPLWIPAYAQYTPDSRKWHPVNDNITVAAGETLNTDHFPRFGEYDESRAEHGHRTDQVNEPPSGQDSMDMFGASGHIARQMHHLLTGGKEQAEPRALLDYLKDAESCSRIKQAAIELGVIEAQQEDDLDALLEVMRVSTMAFTKHRARNVFNSGYAGWWQLVGKKLAEVESAVCE